MGDAPDRPQRDARLRSPQVDADVLITIVFAGAAVVFALGALALFLHVRRHDEASDA
jgi:hypothetical protein